MSDLLSLSWRIKNLFKTRTLSFWIRAFVFEIASFPTGTVISADKRWRVWCHHNPHFRHHAYLLKQLKPLICTSWLYFDLSIQLECIRQANPEPTDHTSRPPPSWQRKGCNARLAHSASGVSIVGSICTFVLVKQVNWVPSKTCASSSSASVFVLLYQ